MTHPRHRLDPVVHFPIRLAIMACLVDVDEAEFGFVAQTVEINAPTCSKQVTVLEAAGYLTVRKGQVGRRPRTWLGLTPAGRRALRDHLAALQAIAGVATRDPAESLDPVLPGHPVGKKRAAQVRAPSRSRSR
jgi:DNA-binding MarR family transcriptional regulator